MFANYTTGELVVLNIYSIYNTCIPFSNHLDWSEKNGMFSNNSNALSHGKGLCSQTICHFSFGLFSFFWLDVVKYCATWFILESVSGNCGWAPKFLSCVQIYLRVIPNQMVQNFWGLDITHLRSLSNVWFARATYHTSKRFCTCVGTCTCDSTPLLKESGMT